MLFFLNIINLINISTNQNNIDVPKPGSIYQKNLNFPIIGNQIIQTEIINNNYAFIRLNGLINQKGTAKYITANNRHLIKFSYNLRNVIKKYKTEITFPYYDIEKDEIIFNLNVKVINYKKKIKMTRIN
jgi:hypothetical protein